MVFQGSSQVVVLCLVVRAGLTVGMDARLSMSTGLVVLAVASVASFPGGDMFALCCCMSTHDAPERFALGGNATTGWVGRCPGCVLACGVECFVMPPEENVWVLHLHMMFSLYPALTAAWSQ